jgi:hypothetical protein
MEPNPLTRDLLSWIASAPRTYEDAMDAWRTSCPRLSIWEDAVIDGLVRVRASRVELTERGRAALDQSSNHDVRHGVATISPLVACAMAPSDITPGTEKEERA